MQVIVPARDRAQSTQSSPIVSVVLAVRAASADLGRALRSVATQTLDPAAMELVVVAAGAEAAVGEALEEVRASAPRLRVRLVAAPGASLGEARNVGLWSARGAFTTFLEPDGSLGDGLLQALLDAAEPLVPVVQPAANPESEDGPEDGPAEPVVDEPRFGVVPLAWVADADTLVVPADLPDAMVAAGGKLLPTGAARAVGFDEGLDFEIDLVFWTRLYAHAPFRFRLVEGTGVAYRVPPVDAELPFDEALARRLDVVAALDTIDVASPDAESVLHASADRQYAAVNAYLHRDPDLREVAVAEIRARGVRTVRWGSLNDGLARHLGIVYTFTPWTLTSGLVAARRVRARGAVTDVICQSFDHARERDESSRQIAEPMVDELRILPGPTSYGDWWAMRAYSRGVFETLAELEQHKKYESVYSRVGWAASHIVAAQYKLRNPHVRWIAEFSDPIFRTMEGEPRPELMEEGDIVMELRSGVESAGFAPPESMLLFEWVEHLPFVLADEIVFTNENQRSFMIGGIADQALAERVQSVATVSHHPTLPSEFYEMAPSDYELDPGRANIGYFGVFYPRRGLTEVTESLARLSAGDRERIKLHVFTVQHKRIRAEVAEVGLGDVIQVNPYAPFLEFLNVTKRFDALIVNDADTSGKGINPYLPSKLSDYLGSGSPIWSIVEPGSVMSTLDLTYRTNLGDVDGAESVLKQIIAGAVATRGKAMEHVSLI